MRTRSGASGLVRACVSLLVVALCWQNSNELEAATIEQALPDNIHHSDDHLPQSQDNNMLELGSSPVKTQAPVIGVLTEVLRDYKRFVNDRRLFIASSYVKWIESAGAQAVPVLLNQDDAYYERVFRETNGLLLPGGDNLLDPSKRTPMMVAAKKLYRLAVAANDRGDFYPIWGTCLGLELLSVLTANRNVLESCEANDIALAMEFTGERGKLFSQNTQYANLPELTADFSQIIRDTLKQENLTYNFHHKCLTDEALKRAGLGEFYRPLAYSRDKNGLKFIAILEAKRYPFYGVQFHPEKPPFEWVVKRSQMNVPHSRQSIAVSRFFADFFVQQAQLSGHSVEDKRQFAADLIYAHSPMYTAPKRDMYEQRYLFPYDSSRAALNGLSDEEFVDHVPESDEEIQEEVSEPGRAGDSGDDDDPRAGEIDIYGLLPDANEPMLTINQVVAMDLVPDEDDYANDREYDDDDQAGDDVGHYGRDDDDRAGEIYIVS